MARPLADLSDAEIADYLAQSAENVVYSYADLLAEVDRRHARGVADANVRFARIAIIIATVSVLVSAVGIVVSVLR